ncbi:MAG: Fic family protein [Saprospiraceae bacterium]|nr:Fic family protein [Saprospiraceae bacterium]
MQIFSGVCHEVIFSELNTSNKHDIDELIHKIDTLKEQIETIRPLAKDVEERVMQKFRLDWNYHSNAIEGNKLTYGETRAFLMEGVTAKGKPLKDHLDIEGHDAAIDYLTAFVKDNVPISQKMMKELHQILLVRPYKVAAVTPNGQPTKRWITVGDYKKQPNHVQTPTGEHTTTLPLKKTPAKMTDLINWYNKNKHQIHPLLLAATFHYQFVAIHPFDDGNGRMARLLMNLILMNKGFVPAILPKERRESDYFPALAKADAGDLEDFVLLIGEELVRSMEIYVKAAKGENIAELDDLDKKLSLLQRRLQQTDEADPFAEKTNSLSKEQGIKALFASSYASRIRSEMAKVAKNLLVSSIHLIPISQVLP